MNQCYELILLSSIYNLLAEVKIKEGRFQNLVGTGTLTQLVLRFKEIPKSHPPFQLYK